VNDEEEEEGDGDGEGRGGRRLISKILK